MKHNYRSLLCALGTAFLLATACCACEKAIFDENDETIDSKDANLTLRIKGSQIDDTFATRAMVDITTYCTRFNFVIYKDGKKVESRSQTKGDNNYGQVSMTLQSGIYKLLVLAHSSQGGNPSLSDPEKIQFTNAIGFSDTFYFYGDIEVTSEPKTHDIKLARATTRLSFVINDELPSGVRYMKFYYTGASGVLNATTGYGGTVNSQQQRLIDVSGLTPPITIPLYTFLQGDEANMQLTVTALEADNSTMVKERTFADIPLEHLKETICEGEFFDHSSENGFSFTAETDWPLHQRITY